MVLAAAPMLASVPPDTGMLASLICVADLTHSGLQAGGGAVIAAQGGEAATTEQVGQEGGSAGCGSRGWCVSWHCHAVLELLKNNQLGC